MATPAEERPSIDHDVHTAELPPLPQRESRITADRWIEAPGRIRSLGADLATDVGYIRRIGRYLLWRAGPAVGASARYGAVDAEDFGRIWIFDLAADGTGSGVGPDGRVHERFRSWKEALRDDRP